MTQVMPDGWLVPLFYARADNSQAGATELVERAIIVAQKTAAGTATANIPIQLIGADTAATAAGRGSYGHAMAESYRRNDPFGELWLLPVDDDGAAVANTHTVTVGGTGATEPGAVYLYVGGYRITVPVANGDTANDVAASIEAEIDAAANEFPLTVDASLAAPAVTLTAKNKGTLGNYLDVRVNYRGAASGEVLPDGITIAIVNNLTGATDPTLTTALANLGDDPFDFIIHAWSDATSLDAFDDLMQDATGRWAPDRMVYGHAWTAVAGDVSTLTALGLTRNAQHQTICGYDDSPDPPWEWIAAHVGISAPSLKNLPSQPLQTLVPLGLLAPPSGTGRWTSLEKQTLLSSGIAVSGAGGDGVSVLIDRLVTTYRETPGGTKDGSYRDVTTMYTLARLMRRLEAVVRTGLARKVLADDGTRFNAGLPIVTPSQIRALIVAEYEDAVLDGLAENVETFKEYLVVQRNETDPNRVDVLYPPDLANQLRVLTALVQFRLQYANAA